MEKKYDILIIGSGPAGLSAAINAKARGKKIAVISKTLGSEKIKKAHFIENYLGLPSISGDQLNKYFLSSLVDKKIKMLEANVKAIYAMTGKFILELSDGDMIEAKAVILATGVMSNKELKNEKKYLGNGVSYCATCDANLYKGKDVIVVGYNDEAIEEVNFISEVASNTQFINLLGKEVKINENIILIDDIALEIEKESKMKLICKNNTYEADGIFIIRDSFSAADMVYGLEVDEKKHVKVNNKFETNLVGLYACGDITGLPYQIGKAVGQGQVAALEAIKYLAR